VMGSPKPGVEAKSSDVIFCAVRILGGIVTASDVAVHGIQFCGFEVRCAVSASQMLMAFV
jgi:hypothetical protein